MYQILHETTIKHHKNPPHGTTYEAVHMPFAIYQQNEHALAVEALYLHGVVPTKIYYGQSDRVTERGAADSGAQ